MRRYWKYFAYGCTTVFTLPQVVGGILLFFGACKYSVIAGESFGEVAFLLTFCGILALPFIILATIVLIHDRIIKKREEVAKAEEERQQKEKQQEELENIFIEKQQKELTKMLRESKKEKIIIKEK